MRQRVGATNGYAYRTEAPAARPTYQGYDAVHCEKAKVFQAMRPLQPDKVVRGQYTG